MNLDRIKKEATERRFNRPGVGVSADAILARSLNLRFKWVAVLGSLGFPDKEGITPTLKSPQPGSQILVHGILTNTDTAEIKQNSLFEQVGILGLASSRIVQAAINHLFDSLDFTLNRLNVQS